MTQNIAIIGLAISALVYFAIAFAIRKKSHTLSDFLPMSSNDSIADIKSPIEFNSATVATTISLATVILAFSELAPFLGTWLLWPVVTTAIGLWVAKIVAPVIWQRLQSQGATKPTLHEFLGQTFASSALKRVAAICTSLGFLGALAIELTVGSEFLVALAPAIPHWVAALVIALIGIGYTSLGGFRAVVVTDRIQMAAIWGSIIALVALIVWRSNGLGGLGLLPSMLPENVYDFSMREGLVSFLIGIAIINIPTFMSDMSVWQRIAASKTPEIVTQGLKQSVATASLSWGGLALIACALVAFIPEGSTLNPLTAFLLGIPAEAGFLALLLLLVVIIGMFAATLSTASTQLMAGGHAIYTDVIHHDAEIDALAQSGHHLSKSRMALFALAIVSTIVVFVLKAVGFTISDLVFAVYGAQLGMVPVVVLALFGSKHTIAVLRKYAVAAVALGFVAGWLAAGYGKAVGDGNLIFLSPAASLFVSALILLSGCLFSARRSG